jgi:hypothetical protein
LESEEKNDFVIQFKEIPEDERLARAIYYIGAILRKQNKSQRFDHYQLRSLTIINTVLLTINTIAVVVIAFMINFKF